MLRTFFMASPCPIGAIWGIGSLGQAAREPRCGLRRSPTKPWRASAPVSRADERVRGGRKLKETWLDGRTAGVEAGYELLCARLQAQLRDSSKPAQGPTPSRI